MHPKVIAYSTPRQFVNPNTLDSQSLLNLDDGSDTIGTVSVGDGGVHLAGVVAEQKHLLVIEGVFWPRDVGQQAGSGRTTRVVGVAMVDEIDWRPHKRPKFLGKERSSAYRKRLCQGGHQ